MSLNSLLSLVQSYVTPLIEVILLSLLIYVLYRLLSQTRATLLVRGALYIGILYSISYFFQFQTLLWLLNLLAPSLVIALAIIFQPEIRRIFSRLSQGTLPWGKRLSLHGLIDPILDALYLLAEQKRGALVVIARQATIESVSDSGIHMDASVSSELIHSIFSHDTKLHDGAILIEKSRLLAAACLLPLSDQHNLHQDFGTRHRAALGMSEDSDAIVLVVSEERGTVSLAVQGVLYNSLVRTVMKARLQELLSNKMETRQ